MHPRTSADVPVKATDVLIAGDILRVVHGGLPKLVSTDPAARLAELKAKHEDFRSFLNAPPHGNAQINACLLYPSGLPGFAGQHYLASRFAYAPLAGTALMASAVHLAAQGKSTPGSSRDVVRFETAAGPAEVRLSAGTGQVATATWLTAPPRVIRADASVTTMAGRRIGFALATAGLHYLVVSEAELAISMDNLAELGPAAAELSAAASRDWPVAGFGLATGHAGYLVMVVRQESADAARVVWVSDTGEVARSAGGTGALCTVAVLQALGQPRAGRDVTITAPGGSFACRADGSSASVTAAARIVARREFLLEAPHRSTQSPKASG